MPNLTVALVGNPNCGKTTLFNALTGTRQHVGNWPGVTVERVSGFFTEKNTQVEVIDLPGTYALLPAQGSTALDETIAHDFILSQSADVIINIVNANNLERHLYLTVQLLEMGMPVILALNMMDIAQSRQLQINVKQLSRELNCPVITLSANRGEGLEELKRALMQYQRGERLRLAYPSVIASSAFCDEAIKQPLDATFLRELEAGAHPEIQQLIRDTLHEDADIVIADTRYQFIQRLLKTCVTTSKNKTVSWTTRIDNIVLNRILGIPIFLGMMYLLFAFAIGVGGYFQEFFNTASEYIFVDKLSILLTSLHSPIWLTTLLANGVGKGLNTVITFIPVLGAMYFFLALLEDSGYMARAAFVVDRCMRAIGLPGKAFVPMIVGFGCNVPAVMAARTLENQRDRILTIMMSPFMSCGARLAIFAVFAAAFFPKGGWNVVFVLYLIGVAMAVLTGFLLQKTILRGKPAPLLMELPAYHVPNPRTLTLHTWQRLKGFVFRAGKLIVPICMLIGVLNTGIGDSNSLLSVMGKYVTPIFEPMGIHADNWPATVGLMTGVLAKEVVIGTLNTLYTQMGNAAFLPYFDGQIGAFAYLLFVLLYFPCVSTMAVMLRELHKGWTIFSAVWMMGIAYGTAVFYYQAATWTLHPTSSTIWLIAIALSFVVTIFAMRFIADKNSLPIVSGVAHELN